MEPTKHCAVYLRASTDRQTVANQAAEVSRLAEARGYALIVYEEVESAAKARPVLECLLADARAGRVQAVAVWALDRLHRSMVGAIQTVLELDRLGVQVLSVREGWLDTSGPVRPLLVAIFGWVAEQERSRLIERTRAGLERARREGKRLGRPPDLGGAPARRCGPRSARGGRSARRPAPKECRVEHSGASWPKTPLAWAARTVLVVRLGPGRSTLASNDRLRPGATGQ